MLKENLKKKQSKVTLALVNKDLLVNDLSANWQYHNYYYY